MSKFSGKIGKKLNKIGIDIVITLYFPTTIPQQISIEIKPICHKTLGELLLSSSMLLLYVFVSLRQNFACSEYEINLMFLIQFGCDRFYWFLLFSSNFHARRSLLRLLQETIRNMKQITRHSISIHSIMRIEWIIRSNRIDSMYTWILYGIIASRIPV